MKNINTIFCFAGWVGFVICLVIIIFLNKCADPSTHTIEKKTTVIYDSTKKQLTAKTPPAAVSIFTVPVPSIIDTAEILKRFFASYTYSQQIQDSSLRFQIFDSITQNKVVGRRTNYNWLKPVKTIESTTITIENNPKGFYAGPFIQGTQKQILGYGFEAAYVTKRNYYRIGIDLKNQAAVIGLTFKLNARGRNKNK
jgi:hypothetical protein